MSGDETTIDETDGTFELILNPADLEKRWAANSRQKLYAFYLWHDQSFATLLTDILRCQELKSLMQKMWVTMMKMKTGRERFGPYQRERKRERKRKFRKASVMKWPSSDPDWKRCRVWSAWKQENEPNRYKESNSSKYYENVLQYFFFLILFRRGKKPSNIPSSILLPTALSSLASSPSCCTFWTTFPTSQSRRFSKWWAPIKTFKM